MVRAHSAFGASLLAFAGGALQRRAENRRLERELAAQAERTGLQLAHDRRLSDLGELQMLLDRSAEASWNVIEATGSLWSQLSAWTEGSLAERGAPLSAELMEARSQALRKIWVLEDLLARLSLRLGRQHAVTTALAAFREAAQQAIKQIPLGKRDASELAAVRPYLLSEVRRTRTTFIDDAGRVAASQM
jgi:hypothetical protein